MINWKIIAVIFIVLFIVETSFVAWSIITVEIEEKKNKECLYDICSEYPEAIYQDGVCYCYTYDMYGELLLDKTKLMGG